MTLRHPKPLPGVTAEATIATGLVGGLIHNAVTVVQFSVSPFGEADLTECVEALTVLSDSVQRGNLQGPEAILISQAVALNAIFTNLALRAKLNMGEHLEATDRYLRLALKAQGQCRATLETLATIKNPPTVIARQANISHGSQQVNNGVSRTHAEDSDSEPNKLLEVHGKRLDRGAAKAPGASDRALASVGTVHRPANTRR